MATTLFRRPAMRWAVPCVVTAAVVGAGIAVPVIASTDDELPERDPVEVVASLAGAPEVPFAGTVVQSADLGLPPLPAELFHGDEPTEGPGPTVTDLLTGSNTARIWYAGPDRMRVALQDETEQSDMIVNGNDLWLWNSTENAALHTTRDVLDENAPSHSTPVPTPSEFAGLALGAFGEDTEISVDGTAQVAGRAAYELVVEPTDERSLIGSVRLAVDGEYGVPLRVQVFDAEDGSGDDPALEVGFTSVTFDEPDESVFDFSPPSGATVEELDLDEVEHKKHDPQEFDRFDPTTVGDGWTSVLVLRGVDPQEMLDEAAAGAADDAEAARIGDAAALADAFLGSLPQVEGSYGSGVVFSSDLVSVLLLDDGRLLVGAVTPQALEEAAALPEAAVDAG